MAGIFHPSRGGVRGGQDQFNWEDVKTDKDRECYLGHSVMVPVGKWQEGKDLIWYTRDKQKNEEEMKRKKEITSVKELEARAMAAALGHESFSKGTTSLTAKELQEVLSRGQTQLPTEPLAERGSKKETGKLKKSKRRKKEKRKKKSKKKKNRSDKSSSEDEDVHSKRPLTHAYKHVTHIQKKRKYRESASDSSEDEHRNAKQYKYNNKRGNEKKRKSCDNYHHHDGERAANTSEDEIKPVKRFKQEQQYGKSKYKSHRSESQTGGKRICNRKHSSCDDASDTGRMCASKENMKGKRTRHSDYSSDERNANRSAASTSKSGDKSHGKSHYYSQPNDCHVKFTPNDCHVKFTPRNKRTYSKSSTDESSDSS